DFGVQVRAAESQIGIRELVNVDVRRALYQVVRDRPGEAEIGHHAPSDFPLNIERILVDAGGVSVGGIDGERLGAKTSRRAERSTARRDKARGERIRQRVGRSYVVVKRSYIGCRVVIADG